MAHMMQDKKTRKSLAVDIETYDLLQGLCKSENRSKIDQLRHLIGNEHRRIKQRNAVEA
jgi:hypothetical protein|tara:strand:+ start:573 stop:749 length:177 start_codon:yes stop_codon:yes gene_type:complete